VLRHGHHVPLGDLVGHSVHGGRADPERPRAVRLLPRGRIVGRGSSGRRDRGRRRPPLPGARSAAVRPRHRRSGLLYSAEFCALARERLTDDGILALWFPGGDPAILSSICRAMAATFPYTRAFQSIEGWGFHLLASRRPIGLAPASALVARLPARAAADLVEWGPWPAPVDYFRVVLERELPFQRLIELAPSVPALTDDRPVNEYFLVRRGFAASAPR
jgi:hypothetical protein